MTVSDGAEVDRFCDHLWLSDGLSPATLASYRQDMARFFKWCETRKLAAADVARSDIEAYLAAQFAESGSGQLSQSTTFDAEAFLWMASGRRSVDEESLRFDRCTAQCPLPTQKSI